MIESTKMEHDTFGKIAVPNERLWETQTERSYFESLAKRNRPNSSMHWLWSARTIQWENITRHPLAYSNSEPARCVHPTAYFKHQPFKRYHPASPATPPHRQAF